MNGVTALVLMLVVSGPTMTNDPPAGEPPIGEPPIGEPPAARAPAASAGQTIPMPTLGGPQFWGDVVLRSGWRIQRNALSGHHRLIDPLNLQHAAGTKGHCLAVLESPAIAAKAPRMSGEVTLLIHGILRGSGSMGPIGRRLEGAGLQPLRWDYPSTRGTIDDAAALLAEAIDSLGPEVTRINFVVHSMGGLVVRAYGGCTGDQTPPCDPRLGRLVMLGTPNHGAEMATHLQNFGPFNLLFGPAGREMTHDGEVIARLPLPPCEFGIVAGIRGTGSGYNPLIPGDDDGTVTLASARLGGASDFLAVRGLHSFLMSHPAVVDAVEHYLQTGAFRPNAPRQPIPAAAAAAGQSGSRSGGR